MRISDWISDVCSSDLGGAVGHRDQVVLHAFDLVDPVAHVQGEQARAGDEETHLVLLVEMLVEELGAHFLALRVVRGDADHVHGLEPALGDEAVDVGRSAEHTSELQSLMRISYAVFCLKKKK